MPSRFTWILDPGHGGLGPGGEYLTAGKRSPAVPPGIYEGDFNRKIAARVAKLCSELDVTITNPGPVNAGLDDRAAYVRGLQAIRKNCVLISIHANASGDGLTWDLANGATAFCHPANARGKVLAKCILNNIGQYTNLATGRGVREAHYTILSTTKSVPGVLIECGFMTNRGEAIYLASTEGESDIALAISTAIHAFENGELEL